MKIVIVSDTHLPRFRNRLPNALERVADKRPDRILHCGDLTTSEALEAFAAIAPVEAVAGNNDGPDLVTRLGRQKILTVERVAIGLVHGDGIRGTTLSRALDAFVGEKVDVIAFGHSHVPYLARHGECWVVNPGSITDKRLQVQYSYVTIEITPMGVAEPQMHYFL